MTEVDISNEPLRRMSYDLTLFYTKVLHEAVRQTFNLNSSSTTCSAPTLTLKCAHDCIVDNLTDETIAPHFVADCAKLCSYLADVVAKGKFGDSEAELYVVLAGNAKKNVTKTSKNVTKYKKSLSKAEKKLQNTIKKAGESVTKAVKKATKARDKAKNALIKAETAAKQAEEKLKAATERAAESIKIQSAVIQCWTKALGALAKRESNTTADCVQSCRVILPPGTKSGDQHQCTSFLYGYV